MNGKKKRLRVEKKNRKRRKERIKKVELFVLVAFLS